MKWKEYLQNNKAFNPLLTKEEMQEFAAKEWQLPKGAVDIARRTPPAGWRVIKGPRGGTYAVPPQGGKQPAQAQGKPKQSDGKKPEQKPSENPKIKVGDRIKISSDNTLSGEETVKVVDIDPDGIITAKDKTGEEFEVNEDWILKHIPAQAQPKQEPKAQGSDDFSEHEVEHNNEVYAKVNNAEEFDEYAKTMGFDDTKDFVSSTGVQPEELVGKWFTLVGGRVFMADEDEVPALDKKMMQKLSQANVSNIKFDKVYNTDNEGMEFIKVDKIENGKVHFKTFGYGFGEKGSPLKDINKHGEKNVMNIDEFNKNYKLDDDMIWDESDVDDEAEDN